jgi:hypothetical protein
MTQMHYFGLLKSWHVELRDGFASIFEDNLCLLLLQKRAEWSSHNGESASLAKRRVKGGVPLLKKGSETQLIYKLHSSASFPAI